LSAEAQRWYLTALASDPRNVEALTGLAITCQHLVSNPWWAEPRVVATASDLGREAAAIALFFGGFAELLRGRTETSISLLRKSLERNPSYGSAHLFLAAALSTIGQKKEATEAAARFRGLYPQHRTRAFEQLWLSRSGSAAYRAQIHPAFEKIRGLGLIN
jgi:tetratricopeptide (TPR) repeat protein